MRCPDRARPQDRNDIGRGNTVNKILMCAAALALMAGAALAQGAPPETAVDRPAAQPGAARGNAAAGPAGQRGPGRGAANGDVGAGNPIGTAEIAPLIFDEKWSRAPEAEPMTQANLGNQFLSLHLYGDTQWIRKTYHPLEDYTYTGETVTNWAITVSDPKNYWDLTRSGKMMLRTRNSGYRFTHVVIKTADGKWFVSEEGSPESTSWIDREYAMPDLHWRVLLMTDTPSNASNRRKPDPKLVPIVPQGVGRPDLSRVEEVGFSDLMPGGWIPSTSRVNEFALYGKKVPR